MDYKNTIKMKLFIDEPELNFVEVDKDDTIFDIGEFLTECISGVFTDYDGFGRFVDTIEGKQYAIDDISFSIDEDSVYYKGEYVCSIFMFCFNFSIYQIVWFNK